MAGVEIHRTRIAAEWIDYNGHLRDAYYALIASETTDALMDRVGLDAGYRARSGCTLYTLEMHLHFLAEVGRDDAVRVRVRLLGLDGKRLHVALELVRERDAVVAAGAALLLLHVQQGPRITARDFPDTVRGALEALQRETHGMPAQAPASRRIGLSRPK